MRRGCEGESRRVLPLEERRRAGPQPREEAGGARVGDADALLVGAQLDGVPADGESRAQGRRAAVGPIDEEVGVESATDAQLALAGSGAGGLADAALEVAGEIERPAPSLASRLVEQLAVSGSEFAQVPAVAVGGGLDGGAEHRVQAGAARGGGEAGPLVGIAGAVRDQIEGADAGQIGGTLVQLRGDPVGELRSSVGQRERIEAEPLGRGGGAEQSGDEGQHAAIGSLAAGSVNFFLRTM